MGVVDDLSTLERADLDTIVQRIHDETFIWRGEVPMSDGGYWADVPAELLAALIGLGQRIERRKQAETRRERPAPGSGGWQAHIDAVANAAIVRAYRETERVWRPPSAGAESDKGTRWCRVPEGEK